MCTVFLLFLLHYLSALSMESLAPNVKKDILINTQENIVENELDIFNRKIAINNCDYKMYKSEKSTWNIHESTVDLVYTHCLQNRTYANPCNTIHNATSLETIDNRTLTINNEKTFYSHHPLQEGITHYKNVHHYISTCSYKCNTRYHAADFQFNSIYDGPSESKKWVIAYYNSEKNTSYIEIILPTCSEHCCSLFSKGFPGDISTLLLDKKENKSYLIIENEDKEKKKICTLYNITFSAKQKKISLSALILPGISFIKKLLLLSNNLLISLTQDGLLYKINVDTQETSLIDVKGSGGRYILLEDIVKNQKIPYLWLLFSKTQELYFLNFKQNKKNITFTKIADAPGAEKIWFDGDHILIKHNKVSMNLAWHAQGSTPEQYSLYALRMVLAKANEPS